MWEAAVKDALLVLEESKTKTPQWMKGTRYRRTVKRVQHARGQQKRRYNERVSCLRQYARVLENECSPVTPEAKALYEFLPELASADGGGDDTSPYCFLRQAMKYMSPPAPSQIKRKKDVDPLPSQHVNPTHLVKRLTSEVRGFVNALSTATLADKVRSLGLPSESQAKVEAAVKQMRTMTSTYKSVADCINSGNRTYEAMVRALAPIIKHLLHIPKFKGDKTDPAGMLKAVARRLKFKRSVWIYHTIYTVSKHSCDHYPPSLFVSLQFGIRTPSLR